MANNTHLQRQIYTLDDYIILWLDCEENNAFIDLQKVFNATQIFNEPDSCIDFITDIKDQAIFLILSNVRNDSLIPLIHTIPRIDCIYVFDDNKYKHEEWMKTWRKVKGVFTSIRDLTDSLKQDISIYNKNSTSISIISKSSVVDLNELESSFMYSQLLKEIILKLQYDSSAKAEFINYLRIKHINNNVGSRDIDEYEQDNDPQHSPIWWYTKISFIYSLLNRALRIQDVNTMIKMGFFLQNLHQQIEDLHIKKSENKYITTVYRGQGMSTMEFEKIKKNIGGLLAFNNFLSTTIDRQVSYLYADSSRNNPDLVGILFEMKIDPSIKSAPFTSLEKISYYPEEKEVLFSMHCVFRIDDIQRLEDRLWNIKLILTSDTDEQLARVTEHLRKEIITDHGWHGLGALMITMGEFDKAEEIYTALNENDHHLQKIGVFDHQLGHIKSSKGEKIAAISYYNEALKRQQNCLPANDPKIAAIYINMGETYTSAQDYSSTLSCLQQALNIQQKIFSPNHPNVALTYNNIGMVYRSMGNYSKALDHLRKTLEIQQQVLPPNAPEFTITYNNLALLHDELSEYSVALWYYEQTLKIQQRILPFDHPDLARTYNNIGGVYASIKEYNHALSNMKKALEILQKSFQCDHPDMASIHQNIGNIHVSLKDYPVALLSFEKALEIRQKMCPPDYVILLDSHNNIAKINFLMANYSIAFSEYKKILQNIEQFKIQHYPELPIVYTQLATLHFMRGQLKEAIEYATLGVDIASRIPQRDPVILPWCQECLRLLCERL